MEVIRFNNGQGSRVYLCSKSRKWANIVSIDAGRIGVARVLVKSIDKSAIPVECTPQYFAHRALSFSRKYHVPVTGSAAALLKSAKMGLVL